MLFTPEAHEALADRPWNAEEVQAAISAIVPGEDGERSLWMGETGIRLVLQRLAPSEANLARLSRLIAANESDGRRDARPFLEEELAVAGGS